MGTRCGDRAMQTQPWGWRKMGISHGNGGMQTWLRDGGMQIQPPEAAPGRVRGWWLWVRADSALPQLLEMKSTDRKQTLLHYLVRVIMEKYPELTGFHTELHFLDKAGTGSAHGSWAGGQGSPWHSEPALTPHCSPPAVSLDGVLQDVRSLQQGMELTRREFMRQDDSPVLKDFLKVNSEVMEKLQADSKTAKVGAGVEQGRGGSPLHGDTLGWPLLTALPHGRGSCLGCGSGGTARRAMGQDGEVGEAGRRQ